MATISPLHQIFAILSDYSKTMGGTVHEASLRIARTNINYFKDVTQSIHNQMLLKGLSIVVLNTASAGSSVAGSLIKGNDLMKSHCETAAKFFQGITPASDTWFGSQISGLETKKELTRMGFQESQETKRNSTDLVRRAQDAAQTILQAHSRR
jgi:hypothetical protein